MHKFPIILLLGFSILACAHTDPYENFKNFLRADIGKSANDPNILINRYPESFAVNRVLDNGNTEIEHHWGECRYMFEISQENNKLIGWRFEGTEHACSIVP